MKTRLGERGGEVDRNLVRSYWSSSVERSRSNIREAFHGGGLVLADTCGR